MKGVFGSAWNLNESNIAPLVETVQVPCSDQGRMYVTPIVQERSSSTARLVKRSTRYSCSAFAASPLPVAGLVRKVWSAPGVANGSVPPLVVKLPTPRLLK